MAPSTPLAIDATGEMFPVPEDAVGWRVRRFAKSGKGTPEALYRQDGTRLTIPINAEADELYEALRHCSDDEVAGKYRIDPIDEDGDSCGDTPGYIVYGSGGAATRTNGGPDHAALNKALECNARLVNSVVDALKVISTQYAAAMESSAKAASLRAQHLPAGDSLEIVQVSSAQLADGDDDGEVAQKHTVDWTPMIEQLAPIVSQFSAVAAAKLGSKIMGMDIPTSPPNHGAHEE